MKKSQVYTKTGDRGTTSLIGGTRVTKNHIRLEAYGSIDELNSYLGFLWSYDVPEQISIFIQNIQSHLFVVGAYLATDSTVSDLRDKLDASESHILLLEREMDSLEDGLPELKTFVLPGGHPLISSCHVARTVCRRAERRIIELSLIEEIDPWVIRYVNRLSDYLFVLSRFLSNFLNLKEIPWVPVLHK